MGKVFRQSIWSTIITFIGALIGAAVVYYSTLFLPTQELGFSRNLLSQALIGSQFVLMGMHTTIWIYIHKYPNEHKGRPALITLSLLTPIITTLLLSIPYYIFKQQIISAYTPEDMTLVDKYFTWLPWYVLLWSLIIALEHFLNAHMKIFATSFQKEIVLRLFNLLLIVAYGKYLISFDLYIKLTVLSLIVPIIWFAIASRRIERAYLTTDSIKGFLIPNLRSIKWSAISRSEYKAIFSFAGLHLLLNLSNVLLDYIDIIMIPLLSPNGMAAAGVYFIAVYIMSIHMIPYRALTVSVMPKLTKEFQADDMEKAGDTFKRSSINIWIASLGISALTIANLDNAIKILPDGFSQVYTLVLILIIGRIVNQLSGMNTEVISVSKYYKVNFVITSILIVLVAGLNYILIPRYGIVGAAWGTTIAISIHNIVKMVYVWLKFRLHPFSKGSISIMFSAATALVVGCIIPYMFNPIVDTVIRSIVLMLVYLVLLLLLKPSKDLQNVIGSLKKLF